MSQRIRTPLFFVLLLIVAFAAYAIPGFSSLRKADAAAQNGEHLAAAKVYAHAARILFWRDDLQEKAGISAARGGDFSKALEYFTTASTLTEEGWVWLATTHFQLGDVHSSVESCQRGLQAYDSASLYRLLALGYHELGDWSAERQALENQLRLNEGDAYTHYRFGLLLTLDSPELSFAELTRASELNPEVDSAVQTLVAALELSSTQPEVSEQKLTVGRALGLVQEWELALVLFEQATKIDPKSAEAWAWLGEAKQQTGQGGSAELDQALSLDRTSVNVRALRGLYWSRLGKYEQMLAEYLLAAEYEPENPRWRASVGEAYSRLGDAASALTAYQRAVELAPDDPLYLSLLAMFCAEYGIYIEEIGLPAAQRALTLSPNDPQIMDALGFSYLSSGRYANAEQILVQAVGLAPEYFPAHIHLAMTYLAQGNSSAAFNTLTFVRDADESGVYAEAANQLLQKYFP